MANSWIASGKGMKIYGGIEPEKWDKARRLLIGSFRPLFALGISGIYGSLGRVMGDWLSGGALFHALYIIMTG